MENIVSHLDITQIFCEVDNFCQSFEKHWQEQPILPSMIGEKKVSKRAIIESVNDQLKNISQIEHSRHRSIFNFLVNLLAGLVAYSYRETKPALDLLFKELPALPPACF
jgi:hypothetical protein